MRATVLILVVFATASLASPVLAAQNDARESGAPCAFDTAAVQDTLRLLLTLRPADDSSAAQHQIEGDHLVAQGLAELFRRPAALTLPYWPGTFRRDLVAKRFVGNGFGFEGELHIELDALGSVESIRYPAGAGAPEMAVELIAAIHRADSTRVFPVDRTPNREGLRLIRLTVESAVDLGDDQIPLMSFSVVGIAADAAPEVRRRPNLHYPRARGGRREGIALIQFLIDESGRVPPEAIRVVEATAAEFADAARQMVQSTVFTPAMVRGCPIRMLAIMPIRFTINR